MKPHQPTMREVWRGLAGIQEIAGPQHNEKILDMWRAIGRPDIVSDETAWCAGSQCYVAKRSGYPYPPKNVNTMAKSWLTWGGTVAPEDVQPDDVCIWPRGAPGGPFGHVNTVDQVRNVAGRIQVKCWGGNQTKAGAVTLTDWTDIRGTFPRGIRRGVRATVKDLRPHSSEIKDGDKVQNVGILSTIFSVVTAAIAKIFGPVEVPQFADLPEGLDWWSTLIGGANAFLSIVLRHPWIGTALLLGACCLYLGHRIKRRRVKRHRQGVAFSREVRSANVAPDFEPDLVGEGA